MKDAMLVEMPRRWQRIETFGERVPGDVVVDIHLLLLVLGAHRVVHRPHGFAFAENLERHSLPDVALRAAVGEESGFAAHHVDEARCDHLAVNIQVGLSARVSQVADQRDRVAVDRHPAGHARRAAAIADRGRFAGRCRTAAHERRT